MPCPALPQINLRVLPTLKCPNGGAVEDPQASVASLCVPVSHALPTRSYRQHLGLLPTVKRSAHSENSQPSPPRAISF